MSVGVAEVILIKEIDDMSHKCLDNCSDGDGGDSTESSTPCEVARVSAGGYHDHLGLAQRRDTKRR